MEQILLAYGLPKETVIAITMFYKNMEAMVHSADSNTEFFDVCALSQYTWKISSACDEVFPQLD